MKGDGATRPRPGRVLVAGIGNIFLGDDAFGVEVVRRLSNELGEAALPPEVDVSDYGIRGMHLAYDLLDGRHDVVVMVDALPLNEAPGTLALIEVDLDDPGWTLRPADALDAPPADAHGMDPESVLRLLRSLSGGVERGGVERALVVGCQPALLDEHMGLSAPVAGALDEAVQLVTRVVRDEAARLSADAKQRKTRRQTATKTEVSVRA